MLAGLVCLALAAPAALARLPQAYGAMVVSATPGNTVRVFDLRPAIAAAQAEGKPILLYFGASDCPFCKQLDRHLASYEDRLAPKLRARFSLVEIDGWLRGAKMEFVLPEGRFSLGGLRLRFGDPEPRFLWPTFYWLGSDLRIVRDIPAGIAAFRRVESAEEVLDLDDAWGPARR